MTEHLTSLACSLLGLQAALQKSWNELSWIYNNTRSIDGYPNDPETTQTVEERFHHVSSGLVCVYMFAIIEEFIDPRSEDWGEFLSLLSPEDREKLKAFKHIRNTIAHGFDGSRAETDVNRFDAVMARENPPERIQAIESHDEDKLILGNFAGMECYQFITRIVHSTLERAVNPD